MWRTPEDGQRNCPKHIEFLDKNKFGKTGASVVFSKKKFVTMHGHMNIKNISVPSIRFQSSSRLRHGAHRQPRSCGVGLGSIYSHNFP